MCLDDYLAMTEIIARVGTIGLGLIFACLSLRILGKSHRGSGYSETWLALFFLGISLELFGYWYSFDFSDGSQGLENGVSVSLSSLALLGFIRSVFRPKERWAVGLVAILSVAIPGVFVVPHLLGSPGPIVRLAWTVVRATALLWAVAECSVYYRQMRLRVRIQLADPVIANRFLLWCIWTGGVALMPVAGFGVRLLALTGMSPDYTAVRELNAGTLVLASVFLPGLAVVASALWLSFFPPQRYRDWLIRQAAAQCDARG